MTTRIGQMIRGKAGQVKQPIKKAVQTIDDITVNFVTAKGITTRVETGAVVLSNRGGWATKVFTYTDMTPDGKTVKDEKIRISTYQKDKESGEYKRRDNCSMNAKRVVQFILLAFQWLAPEFREQVAQGINAILDTEEKQAA